jgi:hypothetical protein
MSKRLSLAVLQIIPKHHDLLPAGLVKAMTMLDELGCPYGFYDIERSPDPDFRSSLLRLFASIKEDTILVSMACQIITPRSSH